MQQFIYKLETLKKYQYPFERLKHIEKQYDEIGTDPNEEQKEEIKVAQLEEIKEEQENDHEEEEQKQVSHAQDENNEEEKTAVNKAADDSE